MKQPVGNGALHATTVRDAARPLSGVRDAAVLLEAADKLLSAARLARNYG